MYVKKSNLKYILLSKKFSQKEMQWLDQRFTLRIEITTDIWIIMTLTAHIATWIDYIIKRYFDMLFYNFFTE